MTSEEKKKILILVIVAIIVVVGLLIWKNSSKKEVSKPQEEQIMNPVTEKYVDVLRDGTKLNKSSKLKETKKLDGLEISNVQLTYTNGKGAVLLAEVKNTSSKDIELTPVELTLYDDGNNVLKKFNGLISPVKAGETVQLQMGASLDYSNAYDYTIVKK